MSDDGRSRAIEAARANLEARYPTAMPHNLVAERAIDAALASGGVIEPRYLPTFLRALLVIAAIPVAFVVGPIVDLIQQRRRHDR